MTSALFDNFLRKVMFSQIQFICSQRNWKRRPLESRFRICFMTTAFNILFLRQIVDQMRIHWGLGIRTSSEKICSDNESLKGVSISEFGKSYKSTYTEAPLYPNWGGGLGIRTIWIPRPQCTRKCSHVLIQPVVNFINILCAHFSYESAFLQLHFGKKKNTFVRKTRA